MKTTKEVTLKWIDVNEKLPEENGAFIVTICTPQGKTFVDKVWYGGSGIFNLFSVTDGYSITHWMPFPPPAFEYEL